MRLTVLPLRVVLHYYLFPLTFIVDAQLPRVVRLLENFPRDMLDVIVGCTRKTEVRLWQYLFQYAGRPKDLFEQCMERGMLKSAGGYLLVLHTLEHLKDSSQVSSLILSLITLRTQFAC
jgi:hypothetical protein